MTVVKMDPAKLHIEISTSQTRIDNSLEVTTVELPPIVEIRFTPDSWRALVFNVINRFRHSMRGPLQVQFSCPASLTPEQKDELFLCAKSAGATEVQILEIVDFSSAKPIITDLDLQRLKSTVENAVAEDPELLNGELSHAEIVPQRRVPSDVITMNSRVRILDEDTQKEREITIVYPRDADAKLSRVSVLSPLGAGLLGLRQGASFQWMPPRKPVRKVRVQSIVYQPESAGDWDL